MPLTATLKESRRYQASRRLACLLAVGVIAVGLLVLAGWWLHIEPLTTLSPVPVAIKANTALALALLGSALCLRTTASVRRAAWGRVAAQAAALAVLLLAGLTVLEYVLHIDLGIDQALGAEPAPLPGTPFPGRIAPGTALALALLAGAMLALPEVGAPLRRRGGLYQALAVLAGSLGLVAALGYFYGATTLYAPGQLNAVSPPTAVFLIILALGVLLARPSRGVMSLVLSEQLGGVVARQLLPAALGLPLAIGVLRAAGERAGVYGTAVGLAVFTVATMATFTGLTWWAAHRLNAVDASRHTALTHTQRLQALTTALLRATTPAVVIQTAVEQGAAILGTAGGYLFLLAEDGQALELTASQGIGPEAAAALARVPLDAPIGAAVVFRTGQAEWYESNVALLARYPALAEARARTRFEAAAVLPLQGQERPLGVMVFSFDVVRAFTPEERAFALTVAQQCAQALDRARLFQETQALNVELEARVARRTAELTAANTQLAQSRETLRRLSARLASGHEEQRRQVALAVHEGLAQQLSRLRMDVAWLGQHLDPAAAPLVERIEGMAALINAAIQMARAIAAGLRPAVLDQFGLEAALEAEVADFERRWGGRARLHVADGPALKLAPGRATTLFRLVQDALDNVSRHASATVVDVRVVRAGDCLEVCVEDNGQGLPAGAAEDPHSLGLVSMRERTAQLSGSADFDSVSGQGTRVTFRLPVAGG